jgi:hypothetical protein
MIGPAQPVHEQADDPTRVVPLGRPDDGKPAPGKKPGQAGAAEGDAAKAAELAAYRRWVRKTKPGAGPFQSSSTSTRRPRSPPASTRPAPNSREGE